MSNPAAVRHFLTLKNHGPDAILNLLKSSSVLKEKVKSNTIYQPLQGKSMAMFFHKRSTRTRVSSETGFAFLGGHPLFLGKDDIQLGVNESTRDTAEVVSRLTDLLLARVYKQEDVEELAKYSQVPVINALSDKYHPLQSLADLLTLQERYKHFPLNDKGDPIKIAWVGDGNNIIHSLLMSAPKLGLQVNVATPKGYECDQDVIDDAQNNIKTYGTGLVNFTNNPKDAVGNADVVVTDTFVSMGEEDQKEQKLKDFYGFQVNSDLVKYAAPDYTFLHCLPRKKEEVTDEVIYSKNSMVYEEAENRKYTVMAVMLDLLNEK